MEMHVIKIIIFVTSLNLITFGDAIKCFLRSQSVGSNTNGTEIDCPGYSYCYSFTSASSANAGCMFAVSSGICNSNTEPSCVICSTDLCNSVTPSLTCYHQNSGLYLSTSPNGTIGYCATSLFSCYAYYSPTRQTLVSGCGNCTGYQNCRVCRTSNCNIGSPSSISCYQRNYQSINSLQPGSNVSCPYGITTCMSSLDQSYASADCGSCDASSYRSCVTCSTSNCNTVLPSSISCFFRGNSVYNSGQITDNGTLLPCPASFSTCYHQYVYNGDYYSIYSGCGICNAPDAPNSNCRTCNSSSCNYLDYNMMIFPLNNVPNPTVSSSLATPPLNTIPNPTVSSSLATPPLNTIPNPTVSSSLATPPLNTIPNPTQISNTTTSKSTESGNTKITCYYSYGETQVARRDKTVCPSSSSCFEFSFAFGTNKLIFAGCGTCASVSSFFKTCHVCYDDLCNDGMPSSSSATAKDKKIGALANLTVTALLLIVMKLI